MQRNRIALICAGLFVVLALGGTPAASGAPNQVAPDGALARIAALNARLGLDTPWSQALEQAINPEDYDCSQDTALRNWIGASIGSISADAQAVIFGFGVHVWPTYYALLFDNDDTGAYIGVDGEYTKELVKRHKDNQRFWDVETSDILLLGMHGADIADDAKMVPVVQFLLGVSESDAQGFVDLAQDTIENDSTVDYDHPLFTLNAFAFWSADEPEGSPFAGLPDKIVMGEGIIEAVAAVGYGTNAPDYIHAHEFAHHVQIELGVFELFDPADPDQPERTRRTELMADGFAAYYCAHARGGSFQEKRLADALNAAFDIGDCQFASPGHHGTPNQRDAAVTWGIDLAESAQKQGHIKSSALMLELFDDVLPDLVAPDAGN